MKTPPSSNKKWTYEKCYEEAKKYMTLKEFKEKGGRSYIVSVKNNWIKDFDWLNRKVKPNGYWNYEHCYEEAKKYKTRTDALKLVKNLRQKSNLKRMRRDAISQQ